MTLRGTDDDDALLAHLRRTAAAVGLDAERVSAPRSRFVRAAGAQFRYLDWEAAGRPVLLLHGYGLTAHTWDAVVLGLNGIYRCLALDQRGHGETDWGSASDYVLEARAAAAAEVLNAVGVDEVAVVGQSLGGLVGLRLASSLGRRIAALAVVDASPFTLVVPGAGSRLRDRTFASPDEAFALVRRVSPGRDPDVLRQNLLFNLRPLPDGCWTWRYDQGAEMLRPEDFEARNRALVALLAQVTSPALVVRGARSETLTADSAAKLAAALPDGRMVTISDAGHNVQGDAPRALADALSSFFDDVGYR